MAEGLCIGKDVQGQVAAGVGRGTQNKSGIQELNVGVRVGILVSKNRSKVGGSEGGREDSVHTRLHTVERKEVVIGRSARACPRVGKGTAGILVT